ncbi:MAG: EamA family transporter [Planctomycetota bacterium]
MKTKALSQALIAAILFGLATPFSKTLLKDFQPNQLAGLLYLGAALALAPSVIRRRATGRALFPRDARNRKNLAGAVIFGGIIGPVLLLFGLRLSPASSVSMWLNLESVATAVLSVLFFREHLSKRIWIGNIGVVLAGIVLNYNGGTAGWLGLLCVTGAAIAWGLDNNFTSVIDEIRPEDSTFIKGLIAGGTNCVIGFGLFQWTFGIEWLYALALGGVSYGVSIALYIHAAQGMGATRSQMAFASSPFFGVLFSVLLIGESFGAPQAVAAALMIASVVLLLTDRHRHEHRHLSITHEHTHVHDDHHQHSHPDGDQMESSHSHPHSHEPLAHSHPHDPDLHHRHEH